MRPGSRAARAGRVLLALIVCVAGALGLHALALLVTRRPELQASSPAGWWIWIVATLAGLVVAGAALVQCWRARREPVPGLVGRGLFVLLVLGAAAQILCAPYRRLELEIHAGAHLSLALGWVLLAPRLRERARTGAGRWLDVLAFDLALVLVLSELGLALLARWTHSDLLAQPHRHAARLLEANRRPAGELHLGFPMNARGYYDEEFGPRQPALERVVCIGDSFSVSTVPHLFHYTTVAERLLVKSEVLNLGAGGIGPPEYELLLAEEGLALDPDLIVVAIFVGNDVFFYDDADTGYGRWLRAWLDRDQVYLCTLPARWRAIRRERAAQLAAAGGERSIGGAADERALATREELLAAMPWLADPALESPGFSPAAFDHDQLVHAQGLCQGAEASYGPFFAVLERIRRLAGDRPLGLLVIPEEFQVEDPLWAELAPRLEPAAERARPQRLITDWCRARGVPCEDLLPRLAALPVQADGRRHAYILRNTHFNALGNQVAGEGLAALVGRLRGR